MLNVPPNALVRYGGPVLFVGIALIATTQVEVLAARTPFALFFAAIAAATWFGGRRSGIAALLLAGVAAHYFVVQPVYSFKISLYGAIQASVFFFVALLVIWLMTTLESRSTAIRESETRYGFLFESNPFPMWIVEPETYAFLAVNDAATQYYGYSRDEFLKMTIRDLQPDGDVSEMSGDRDKAVAIRKHQKKDGSEIYVEIISDGLIYDGRPARLIHVIDVTERLQTSAALLASEARLLKVFGNCPVAVAVNRWSDGAFVDVNAEFLRLTGWPREQLIDRTTVECGLVDAATAMKVHSLLKESSALEDVELELRTRRGEIRNVTVGGVFVEMLGEQHVITTYVDITERRRSDSELRASEERLHIVTENARVGLVMINSDRRYTFANPAFANILELSTPNVVGSRLQDIHPQLYEKQIGPSLDRAFAGDSLKYVLRQPTPDGDRYFDVRYEPTKVNGTVVSVVAVIMDITERNRAELEREASEERYRTLFEYSPDGIVISDQRSYYIDANESICEMLRCDRDEIVGLHATDVVVPKEVPHLNETLVGLNADLQYYREWELRRRDGSTFPVEVIATVMPDGNTLTVIRDITERKLLEEQLLQAQKMEAIGVLAGGVAHDFNNILTAISGYSDLTLESMSPDDPLRNYVVEIKDSGIRAAGLTSQLLAFSRKRVLMPSVHNLNVAVMDTERMLRRTIKENIEFHIDLDPALGNIKAEPGQIAQVLVNLVINSRDAMPDGGRLTISTKNVHIGHDRSTDNVNLVPGPFVELTVRDTGFGMDVQTQRRLFEPFFTTKEVGKGTGLGLSTAYGIVKQSGGDIVVQSEPGKGATFKVYLPRVEEAIANPQPHAKPDEIGHGSETILLVEDEATLRTLVNNVLTRNGYKVLVADSGEAALEISNRYPETIHILLTDIVMPGMGGCQLRDELVKARSDIKVLLMSGYAGDSVDQNGFALSGMPFIEKPFTPDELIAKLREVLSAKNALPEVLDPVATHAARGQ